jgi:hypothetical protein
MLFEMSNRESRKTQMGYAVPHEAFKQAAEGIAYEAPPAPTVPSAPPASRPSAPMTPASGAAAPGDAAANGPGSTVANRAPPIEVEYIRETDTSVSPTAAVVLEIWTRNRIYHVDANLACVSVINRSTGAPEEHHTLKGTRLTGGQRRSRSTMAIEIVVPFPVPGTEAVFKHAGKRGAQYGQTSTVERVILRVRKIVVGSTGAEPAWDEITGRFQIR